MADEKVQWQHEKEGSWVDYDPESSQQIEESLSNALPKLRTLPAARRKLRIEVKLDRGSFFGSEPNQKKYIVQLFVDARTEPAVIQRALQYHQLHRSSFVNVTRVPSMDTDNSAQDIFDLSHHKLQYKWFQKVYVHSIDSIESQSDNSNESIVDGWKAFDIESSKQMELAMENEKSLVVLNKGDFASATLKNQCRVKFNHHSIPPQATFHRFTGLQAESECEVKFEANESKSDDETADSSEMDEIMGYLVATKHYMRPVSMRYWMKERELSPNNAPSCSICLEDFTEENFLEYWVSRKFRCLHQQEKSVVSAKRITVQLSQCIGTHFFHSECIAQWLAPQRQCPFCKVRYGVEIGNQPEGVMTVRIVKKSDVASKGKENKGKGTIEIVHRFPSGVQTSAHQNPGQRYSPRTEFIYLPNTKEGREILGMIHVGWKRKVLYTVGRSVTKEMDNQIIWNGVHFKTSKYGGIENYGWPDATYYARAKDEFKQKGITVEDIPKRYQQRR